MSGRQSGGKNTLFNYFNKVPGQSNGKNRENGGDNNETPNTPKDKRQLDTSNGDDNENIQPTKRIRRIIQDSDSSDNECNVSLSSKFSTPKKGYKTPKKSNGSTPSKAQNTSTSASNRVRYGLSLPAATISTRTTKRDSPGPESEKWLHDKLDFLKKEFIRDKMKRRFSDDDYDPRTLYVPPDFICKQTPAMQQWWTIKQEHFDCVLFFKVGKFYELYHMDAVIGVNELGFSFMKGEFAHSGFPESAYGRMASSLVDLGYKVARVEQTETPDAMNKRLQSTSKGIKQNKVVSREICQITNKATRVQGLQDLQIKQPLSTYLLAIYANRTNNNIEFGVCFVDTSIGTFYVGKFDDDDRYSRLLTMLAQYPPAVILEERNQLGRDVKAIMKTVTGNASFESLSSGSQFLTSTKTLQLLQENDYFERTPDGKMKFPTNLQSMISSGDPLNTTCREDCELAVRCFGACMWYLKDCLLDIQLISMGKFEEYIPSDMTALLEPISPHKYMILDCCAMSSLNIIGRGNSLQNTLDHCCTAMGKRLLRQWVCKPLCNVEEIRGRQEAITELIQRQHLMQEARTVLKSLPDLERLISRIYSMGSGLRARKHPDSRAIFYEEKTYSKRKVRDFILALNGFERAAKLRDTLSQFESRLLLKYIGASAESHFPDIMEIIVSFKNSFNSEEAGKEGKIIPDRGFDEAYDRSLRDVERIQEELNDYLKSQQKYFGCAVSYFGTDKKRYQLEVPEYATHKANRNYSLEGTKKGSKPAKRYTTDETKSLLAKMMAAETKSQEALHDINRRIFEKFSEKYEEWSSTCYCLAMLDVLVSMAQYTLNQNFKMCVPDVQPFSDRPILELKESFHPTMPNIETLVANDIDLGTGGYANILIVTGPNMGGKSTLMRQVALLTIMAQLGCHVPAKSMRLSLVDRIFTRLGAHDDIMTGNSTFLVELKEAAAIIRHATFNSLVLLDELGRGTATYDGTAIATSYVEEITNINCRTIFSTHYYALLDFYKKNNCIQLAHMACKVESDGDDVTQETVIFMYKLIPGPCPKSYGFNAARLAGIPRCVTSRARLVSRKLESETIARKFFRQVLCEGKNAREILNGLSV